MYTINIKESALKTLSKIELQNGTHLFDAVEKLKINPSADNVLRGYFSGLRRIRIGDYRIVYEVQNEQLVIPVIRVAHRREVYK